MHRKQQMLYSAKEIMCNTLKVQRRFKSNLDITFMWYDDLISASIDYEAYNKCVSMVSM